MKNIVQFTTLSLLLFLVLPSAYSADEINKEDNTANEKLELVESKISSLNESFNDLLSRQEKLNKDINESQILQNAINSTASNLVNYFEGQYSENKSIPISISQKTNWYPYLLPLITIFIVIASTILSIKTIQIKSKESLTALEASNKTLVDINDKTISEEHDRSQKTIITNNRQEWINTLRNEITLFLGVVASTSPTQKTTEMNPDDLKSLWNHSYKIELLINPKEEDHKELVRLIREEISNLVTSNESTLISNIISQSQKILKREWERVKNFENYR